MKQMLTSILATLILISCTPVFAEERVMCHEIGDEVPGLVKAFNAGVSAGEALRSLDKYTVLYKYNSREAASSIRFAVETVYKEPRGRNYSSLQMENLKAVVRYECLMFLGYMFM